MVLGTRAPYLDKNAGQRDGIIWVAAGSNIRTTREERNVAFVIRRVCVLKLQQREHGSGRRVDSLDPCTRISKGFGRGTNLTVPAAWKVLYCFRKM